MFYSKSKGFRYFNFSGWQTDPATFMEQIILSSMYCKLVCVKIYVNIYTYFWTLSSVPLVLLSSFVPVACSATYWSFIISCHIWKHKSFKHVLCLQVCFPTFLLLLHFHVNSAISLSISTGRSARI